jgi:hypothetical protein
LEIEIRRLNRVPKIRRHRRLRRERRRIRGCIAAVRRGKNDRLTRPHERLRLREGCRCRYCGHNKPPSKIYKTGIHFQRDKLMLLTPRVKNEFKMKNG